MENMAPRRQLLALKARSHPCFAMKRKLFGNQVCEEARHILTASFFNVVMTTY
jgi:hypothetical protein